jgi:hypothetical protein
VAGDISTEETVAAVVGAAGGRVDALANVASIMDNFAAIHELDDDLWDRVIRINVTALVRLTRAGAPLMLEAGTGSVVNVASPRPGCAGPPPAPLRRVQARRRQPDQELGGDVRAQGPALQRGGPRPHDYQHRGYLRIQLAVVRLGPLIQATVPTPATVAQLAVSITFLLSDDGTNVNGAFLASDCGWSAL